jgi:hypothetical protein
MHCPVLHRSKVNDLLRVASPAIPTMACVYLRAEMKQLFKIALVLKRHQTQIEQLDPDYQRKTPNHKCVW